MNHLANPSIPSTAPLPAAYTDGNEPVKFVSSFNSLVLTISRRLERTSSEVAAAAANASQSLDFPTCQ